MKRALSIGLRAAGVGVALVCAVAGAIAIALDLPEPLPAPRRGAVFERAVLVEPGAGTRGPARVEIRDGRIAAIGPPGARRDAWDGAFLLPGLVDMHAHLPATGLPGDDEYTSLLFLLHGVTAVRLAGGVSAAKRDAMRDRIEGGLEPGPRYFSCGPWIDGPEPVLPGARVAPDPASARAIVAELAAAGVDCIKAYDRLDAATVRALREAAHENGLRVIGHTPQAVSFESAALDDVQHLRGAHPPFEDEDLRYPYFLAAWLRADDAWLAALVETSRRLGITHTPTLVATEGAAVSRDWERHSATPAMQLWLPHLRDGVWSGEVGFSPGRFISDETARMVVDANTRMARAVAALHAAGVPIHTGSDANAPNVVPGASLHRELRLLADAGLGAVGALEASTRVSSAWLRLPSPGRIEVGAPANLVLFGADPTRDLAALDTLVAVVADGRLYARDDLEARLERYRDHYDGFAFRRVFMPLLRGAMRLAAGLAQR